MKPKLVFIEGLSNSGKTTALTLTVEVLREIGIPAKGMYEFDLDTALDNHCNAFVTEAKFESLRRSHPKDVGSLDRLSEPFMDGRVFRYLKYKDQITSELLRDLSVHDFYALPIEENYRLVNGKWKDFLEKIADDGTVYVVECAILQNPTHISLIRDNLPVADLRKRVIELFDIVKVVESVLLYIGHKNPESIYANRSKRSPGWIESNLGFFTHENKYGRVRGFHGEAGAFAAYRHLYRVHMQILAQMPCPTHIIDNTDYDAVALEEGIRRAVKEIFQQ